MYNFLQMRVAVISKSQTLSSPERKDLLSRIQTCGNFELCEISKENSDKDFDRILVFGGDGTVLEAVHCGIDAPILGVNLGNLGFLTQFDKDVDALTLAHALTISNASSKMLLEVENSGVIYNALNDVVVKSVSSRPTYIDVFVDEKYVDSYHGDGVVISTPTGSTAYSLSCGGPVLSPDIEAIIINPICAHSLHSRPLVVSSNSKIQLVMRENSPSQLCIDGENVSSLESGNKVIIQKSSRTAKFIAVENDNFFKKLLDKMNVWGVTSSYKG